MAEEKQVTWGGRFKEAMDPLMSRFSESVSFDFRLAPYDIQCSKAHSSMLCHVGLLTEEEMLEIHAGLDSILEDINVGVFKWDTEFEDVHMNIEQALKFGNPAAEKLHTGRSRNDQVATDMRLFMKNACQRLDISLHNLLSVLLEVADAHQSVYIPGYTHLQRAQPISLAFYFLGFMEMFSRDRERFSELHERANYCPLGCGALAGSTLPLDREFTARELGFVDEEGNPRVMRNALDAVADRDILLEFQSACAICGVHFSRLAEDLILYNTSEFGFVRLPDRFTTGSSLMPHKKNPDSLELLRGKSARLQGNMVTLFSLVKGLPTTYNRDLQEDKPPVFDSFDQTEICLDVLVETLDGMEFDRERCMDACGDPLLLVTDLADYLVERGVPFRKSHHIVGEIVARAEGEGRLITEFATEELQEFCEVFDDDWYGVFDLHRSMERRNNLGMPGPRQIEAEIERWHAQLIRA